MLETYWSHHQVRDHISETVPSSCGQAGQRFLIRLESYLPETFTHWFWFNNSLKSAPQNVVGTPPSWWLSSEAASMCLPFFFKALIFLSTFRFLAKLKGSFRKFPYSPCLHTCTASPYPILHQSRTFGTTDEQTITHHHHPECTVCHHSEV